MSDPDPLAYSVNARLARLALFLPLAGLSGTEDPYGRRECAFLLLNALLDAMEQSDQGLSREEMIARVEPYLAERDAREGRQADFAARRGYLDRLIDTLRNAGQPFRPDWYDYAVQQAREGEAFRLISVEEVGDQGRYTLTAQGLALLYRLHEVDEVLQVELDLLLIHRQIQKGQYDRALQSMDRLDHACRANAARFAELRRRILHGVERIRPEDIQAGHRQAREQLRGEADLFDEIHHMLQHKEDETQQLAEHHPASRRAVLQLARIRQRLAHSQQLHTGLAADNLAIRELYEEMLRRAITLDRHYARLKPLDDLFLRYLQGYGDDVELPALLLPLRRRRLMHLSDWLPEDREPPQAQREDLLEDADALAPEAQGRLEALRAAAAHLAQRLLQAGGRLDSRTLARQLEQEDTPDTAPYLLVLLLLHNQGELNLDSPLAAADPVLAAFCEQIRGSYRRLSARGGRDRHRFGPHAMTRITLELPIPEPPQPASPPPHAAAQENADE